MTYFREMQSERTETYYRTKSEGIQRQIDQLERRINLLSFLRLGVILLGGIALFNTIQLEEVYLTIVSVLVVLLLFIALVSRQAKKNADLEKLKDLKQVYLNEIDPALSLYHDGADFEEAGHPYAADLDIFGRHSVYAKVNRAATFSGMKMLASWLKVQAPQTEIAERQESIAELMEDPEWLHDFQASLLFQRKERHNYGNSLDAYLKAPMPEVGGALLGLYAKLTPWLLSGLIIASYWIPGLLKAAGYMALINLLICMGFAGRVGKLNTGASKMGDILNRFSSAFRLIESRNFESVLLKKLRERISQRNSGSATSKLLNELGVLINKLEYRLNVFVGAFLNALLLWDIRQSQELLKWRGANVDALSGVIDELAAWEALLSLTKLRLNEPDWVVPSVESKGESTLRMKGGRHPLIPAQQAVGNDYEMTGHRVALITGSNMAGKSTFLRTVGVNVVLALAGAVVCAEEMQLSPLLLVSYMRIKDDLQESTSTFKAELNRLQLVLDRVAQDKNSFFLIDEMLRGTNSKDKYLGSKAIIERLIALGGHGMVATHDLQLAELSSVYPQLLENFHFDIQVQQGEMQFDYRLKDGPCTIFNASLLLRKIGIEIG